MKSDFLYHINVNVADTDNPTEIREKFGDVKVRRNVVSVCTQK